MHKRPTDIEGNAQISRTASDSIRIRDLNGRLAGDSVYWVLRMGPKIKLNVVLPLQILVRQLLLDPRFASIER
jgi:hypothetical protein